MTKSSNQPARAQWEEDITQAIEAEGITRSDAQAILEGQERAANVAWCLNETAAVAAARILKASEPADPGPATNPNGDLTAAQEAIESADAALSNAILPTYTELLAALSSMCDALPSQQTEARRFARLVLARHDKTMAGDFR